MLTYRICRRAFRALDGEGARLYGGRWNRPGSAVVYTSGSVALAALELLVHLSPADAPRDLVLVTVEIPDSVSREQVGAPGLPRNWAQSPEHPTCRARGQAWLAAATSAVLIVPAAPVPEEFNYLLNPAHPDFVRIHAVAERSFAFDPRLGP